MNSNSQSFNHSKAYFYAPPPISYAIDSSSTLDFKTASIIDTSFVHSKLDYGNSLFLNLDTTQIERLPLIQNSLAWAVTRTHRHHHITLAFKSLHRLKFTERIHFKVLSVTNKSIQLSQPTYLRELFTIQVQFTTRRRSRQQHE